MFPPKPRSKTKPDKIRVKHPFIFKFNVVTFTHAIKERGRVRSMRIALIPVCCQR